MAALHYLIRKTTVLTIAAVFALLLCGTSTAMAQTPPAAAAGQAKAADSIPANPGDSLKYPISDRRGDKFSNPNRSPIDLKDPKNVIDSIEYDPVTRHYYIVEKIGGLYYRNPTYLTFDEVMRIRSQQMEKDRKSVV